MSKLVIFTAIQNQAPYLLEWVAHHRACGIRDIMVYHAPSDDGSNEIAVALAAANYISAVPISDAKPSIYIEAQKTFANSTPKQESDWFMALDICEFIHIDSQTNHIEDLLSQFPNNTDAIVLPRLNFGNNGVADNKGAKVLEQLNRRMDFPSYFPYDVTLAKTITRNRQIFPSPGFFRPSQKPQEKSRKLNVHSADRSRMPDFFTNDQNRRSVFGIMAELPQARIHYYPLRSLQSFIVNGYRENSPQQKSKPAKLEFWVENNFNVVEDCSMDRIASRRDRFYDEMRLLAGVDQAINTAEDWHRGEFERLVDDPKIQNVYAYCLMATQSTQPPAPIAKKLQMRTQTAMDAAAELKESANEAEAKIAAKLKLKERAKEKQKAAQAKPKKNKDRNHKNKKNGRKP